MTLEDLELLCQDPSPFSDKIAKLVLGLMDVAKAAKKDALRWNEEYCSREDCEVMSAAWAELDDALSELEKP